MSDLSTIAREREFEDVVVVPTTTAGDAPLATNAATYEYERRYELTEPAPNMQERVRETVQRNMPSDASMKKGAVAAAAAAPFVLRAISKWRSNPKHKKVRDHMTAGAVVVREHETVAEASEKLRDCEIGALPVGRGGELVGVLTDRDIVTQVVANRLDPETTFVRDLAVSAPVVIAARDSIEDAAKLMMRHGVRRLPVIENERLVGMIAQADLASAIGPEQAGVLLEAISEAPAND